MNTPEPAPEHDAVEIIGGDEQRDIVIAEPDPTWRDRFGIERRRIVVALGPAARVEHVGSTAVPGLAAKPIIDIQVAVADADDDASFVPQLEGAGYVLRAREAGHRLLRTPARDVHVHVCTVGSEWERRHLLFRDHLRADEVDRRRYEGVKRELAARTWRTMQHYADAKDAIVASIMDNAEEWAVRSGWSVPG